MYTRKSNYQTLKEFTQKIVFAISAHTHAFDRFTMLNLCINVMNELAVDVRQLINYTSDM